MTGSEPLSTDNGIKWSRSDFPSRRAVIRLTLAGMFGQALGVGRAKALRGNSEPVFSPDERATLSAIAETLVPGAMHANTVEFVSAMLADPDPMLCYRFLNLPMPPLAFYKASLDAIADLSLRTTGRRPDALSSKEGAALIAEMLLPDLKAWTGPPAALVYFVMRNDAVDAVYGDERAYTNVDVPYMAHIEPPARW